jgi:hypothetical protein
VGELLPVHERDLFISRDVQDGVIAIAADGEDVVVSDVLSAVD